MKRDDDYLRDLLIEFEGQEDWLVIVVQTLMSGDDRKKHYHVGLLCDAGLMTQIDDSAYRITNDGHDYLATIRSSSTWNKTKDGAAAVGGMTLSMMKDLAVAYVKQEAAEKLGVQL